MIAYEWLGKDGYDCYICCNKEEAMDIISIFGKRAKAPTCLHDDGVKYSYYVLNTKDKIITPIKNQAWISHPDWCDPLVGKERNIAVILDRYRFYDCMYP